MRYILTAMTCVAIGISLLAMTSPWARAQAPAYRQLTLIKVPGVPPQGHAWSFDIAWVDPGTHRFYLADRDNNALTAVDTTTNRFLGFVAQRQFVGFRGKPSISGPDGLVVIGNEAWVGDGNSRLLVVNLSSGLVEDVIRTGPATNRHRADELAYDPTDHLIAIANNEDDPPYLTFISTTDHRVVGTLEFPDATDGIEQPAYEPTTGMLFQSVPATQANPGGLVAKIDPKTMKVVAAYPLTDCNPAGLAVGPQQRLMVGCGQVSGAHAQSLVIDARDGHVVATVTQVGGEDMVWYNPGDNRYYLAARNMTANGLKDGPVSPVLGVVDAGTNQWITNLPTAKGAHSVAADPMTNQVYVPVPTGIAVFASQ